MRTPAPRYRLVATMLLAALAVTGIGPLAWHLCARPAGGDLASAAHAHRAVEMQAPSQMPPGHCAEPASPASTDRREADPRGDRATDPMLPVDPGCADALCCTLSATPAGESVAVALPEAPRTGEAPLTTHRTPARDRSPELPSPPLAGRAESPPPLRPHLVFSVLLI